LSQAIFKSFASESSGLLPSGINPKEDIKSVANLVACLASAGRFQS
jgi:hypothetical protein